MRAFTIEFWFKSVLFPHSGISVIETCSNGFLQDNSPCVKMFVKMPNT